MCLAAQNTNVPDLHRGTVKSISAPIPKYSPEAEIPPEAHDRHINGLCIVALIVDTAGTPQSVRVVRCTDPVFVENSLAAVRQYRFSPATKQGTPVPVMINVEVNFRVMGWRQAPDIKVNYTVRSLPGTVSAQPDNEGVYSLTGDMDPPQFTKFVDKGYGELVFATTGNGSCDVVLVVDAKGKPSEAKAGDCQLANLQKPAVDSLRASKFMPGHLKGAAVPVRVLVHLEFGGYTGQ
jgi:TonB family protein